MTNPASAPVRRYTPDEARDYLERNYGIRIAPCYIATLRSRGTGPAYRKVGARIMYDGPDLDAWAAKRLGEKRTSTRSAA